MAYRNMEKSRIFGRLTAAATIGGALLLSGVPAWAIDIATCGFNASVPGNYQLTKNLTCGVGDAIKITASQVSLKLNGFTIKSDVGALVGINVISPNPTDPNKRLNHVGIEGPGLILSGPDPSSAFTDGIAFDGVDYSQVDLVTIAGAGSNGVYAIRSTFLTIASNVITRSAGGGGFLYGCYSCVFAWNDVSGNAGIGILFDPNGHDSGRGPSYPGGVANTVNNNTMNGNSVGIEIQDGLSGTRVYGNVTNGNAQYGIQVFGSSNQTFSNSARGNGIADLTGNCSNSNVWGNDVFFTPSGGCFH